MGDLQILFAVLVAVYCWECLGWVPTASVVFATLSGRRWRIYWPSRLAGNQTGGFVLANPLPPLGTILLANPFLLSLSPEGVLGFVSSTIHPRGRPRQTCLFRRFEGMEPITAAGSKVKIGSQVLVRASSRILARSIASQLRRLTKLPSSDRAVAIRELLQASLDTSAIRSAWEKFARWRDDLRWFCNGLFCYAFVVIPIVIARAGLERCWWILLLGLLGIMATVAWRFRTAHQSLYPEATEERFNHFLTILLTPTAAIRALDALSRPLLESFHPLAVARVICSTSDYHTLARSVLLDVRTPALPHCPLDDPQAEATERFCRAELQHAIEDHLRANGMDLADLAKPPRPLEASCRFYCPRCENQFVEAVQNCPDCGGIPLRPFEKHEKTRLG